MLYWRHVSEWIVSGHKLATFRENVPPTQLFAALFRNESPSPEAFGEQNFIELPSVREENSCLSWEYTCIDNL